ncbi:MAG: FliH/SctL family protein [Candidatus Scalinduaceae bacterium]
MSRKTIYKLPIIEKTMVLESKISAKLLDCNNDENKNKEILETLSRESYQRGYDDALKKTQNDVEHICQSLKKAIEVLKCERNTIWEQCEHEIIKLALAITKKAVYHEISKDSSKIIERVVAESINKVKESKILKIHLNPVDIEGLRRQKTTEFMKVNEDYELVSDTNITSGGCKVVTDFGNVDARLETRWSEIKEALGVDNPEEDYAE